jgi:hypothetical protein
MTVVSTSARNEGEPCISGEHGPDLRARILSGGTQGLLAAFDLPFSAKGLPSASRANPFGAGIPPFKFA